MISLCIFDLDGLLIDSERYMWTPSEARACKEQGFELTDEIHTRFMGTNFKDTIKILEDAFPGIDGKRVLERAVEINNEYIEKGIPLMKGALELLDYLKESGIKTCIGTSTERKPANKVLDVLGIRDRFDEIVYGDDITRGKPNPDIYLKCLSKFDIKKEEAVVFEDAQAGGLAAIGAGVRLILVPDLAYINDDVKSKAYKVLNSLDEAIDIIKKENETTSSI